MLFCYGGCVHVLDPLLLLSIHRTRKRTHDHSRTIAIEDSAFSGPRCCFCYVLPTSCNSFIARSHIFDRKYKITSAFELTRSKEWTCVHVSQNHRIACKRQNVFHRKSTPISPTMASELRKAIEACEILGDGVCYMLVHNKLCALYIDRNLATLTIFLDRTASYGWFSQLRCRVLHQPVEATRLSINTIKYPE